MQHEQELIKLLYLSHENCRKISGAELFNSDDWLNNDDTLPIMLGKNLKGEIITLDLASAVNLLIVGVTGSGKSVFQQLCLFSLLLKHNPKELKLILISLDAHEFWQFENLPYLHFPIITELNDALRVLKWLENEIKRRYEILQKADCREIRQLNSKKPESLPYIVLFISGLSFLMLEDSYLVDELFCKFVAKSRRVGIHLIIATKRTGNRVLTEAIRINFPTKIVFQLANRADSIRVLGERGAENLHSNGDMLFHFMGKTQRIQSGFLEDGEIKHLNAILNSLYKNSTEALDKIENNEEKVPCLTDALKMIFSGKRIAISDLQMHLRIGYNSAANIISYLEKYKIIARNASSSQHELLVNTLEEAEEILNNPPKLTPQESALRDLKALTAYDEESALRDLKTLTHEELKKLIAVTIREVLEGEMQEHIEIIADAIRDRD